MAGQLQWWARGAPGFDPVVARPPFFMRSLPASFIVLAMGALLMPLVAQDNAADPAGNAVATADGPEQLLEAGVVAFQANDLAGAEAALEKFIADYGENPAAAEAVRIHRPVLAICKVGLKKFGEALPLIDECLKDAELKPELEDELSFWKGICLTQQGELVAAQEAFGEYFANPAHSPAKRQEALLLFCSLYVQQGFHEIAAELLEEQSPIVLKNNPEAASRAAVLQLYSLIEAENRDGALELVREQYPRLNEMTQLVSFQMLALKLGSSFLEAEEYHKAIACLQRIWPAERLMRFQTQRLEELNRQMEVLKARRTAQAAIFQLDGIIRRVEREVANFSKVENFDSALRLRLATAFQGLERYREAALVMEGMLQSLPADPVVDTATLSLMQCWMEIDRWPKAVAAADLYMEKFGDQGGNLQMVMFLRGEALREDQQPGEAQLAYGELWRKFPESDLAPKSLFMEGFMYMTQDDNEGALYHFEQLRKNYPDSGMIEDVDYWSGMAMAFNKDYEDARQSMMAYLDKYGSGGKTPSYRTEALFRIAVCTFSLAEYPESIEMFRSFLAEHGDSAEADEARLLLGDAYLGEGEIEKGLAAYQQIRPGSTRFFEEGWFKMGKALKMTDQIDAMRAHYEKFLTDYPGSGRMPEAVYWIGWTHTQNGEPEKARDIYWQTIETHGNDPDMFTMEDLFMALPKTYAEAGDEGRDELLARLEKMRRDAMGAEDGERNTIALRASWLRASLMEQRSREIGKTQLMVATPLVDPKVHNPWITVDIADAQREAENLLVAKNLYAETRKWHPRAIQKDRIYAGLGRIAAAEGEMKEAITFFERFEKETAQSARLGEVLLDKAQLLRDSDRGEEAMATLEGILEKPVMSSETKARTLLAMGDLLAAEGEALKASAYYERIYAMYGKYGSLVASAYWRRAEALSDLVGKRQGGGGPAGVGEKRRPAGLIPNGGRRGIGSPICRSQLNLYRRIRPERR